MRVIGFILAILFASSAWAQFTSPAVQIHHTKTGYFDNPVSNKLGKKAAGNQKACDGDTLLYGYIKATAFVAVNISNGYRLGQYFETPGDVTVSGFDFYAWMTMGTTAQVEVYAQLYEAGADSLPSGSPIRSDTLFIDSTFRGGVLDTLRKHANWTPYTTNKPYVLVLITSDTNRVGVVTNSYANGDGEGENLGCGSIGGRWYQFDDLNIGGTTLDCDVILEPYVNYKMFNDFDFDDCYDWNDTVDYENTSSPFFFSQVYNWYMKRGFDYLNHRWDYYGTGSNQYTIEGQVKYNSPLNRNVRLISTLNHYKGGGRCIDTTVKLISYQPSEVDFIGDQNICSGIKGSVDGLTNGTTHWYRSPSDTAAFLISKSYVSAQPLEANDTLFAQGINNQCESSIKRHIIRVTTTPDVPTISDDSICLNSLANLVAKSNAGIIRWYADSTTPLPVHTGEVFQVGPLSQDTFFFAQAINGQCTHAGRVRATAYVNSAFAPQDPVTSNDTTLCLGQPGFFLHASSNQQLRWFDKAAGGTPIAYGDSIFFDPKARGDHYRFVDSYNGNCASSRLPIHIRINHFQKLNDLKNQSACEGDSIYLELLESFGGLNWFTTATGGSPVFTGFERTFRNHTQTDTFYLEPFEGMCADTLRHIYIAESIPYGVALAENLPLKVCDLYQPVVSVQPSIGEVHWYDEDLKNELGQSNSLTLPPIEDDITLNYIINNRGCATSPRKHTIQWTIMPDANYDYQVVWRNVDFASRLIGQGDYVWYFNDGTDTSMGTDVKHYFAEDGNYDVSLIVTSPDGCADTVVKTIEINTLGIQDPTNAYWTITPNPTSGSFKISSESDIQHLSILDVTGREVNFRYVGNVREQHIELDAAQAGTYFILLKTDTGLSTGRLVIR